jgi:hypothetical protein
VRSRSCEAAFLLSVLSVVSVAVAACGGEEPAPVAPQPTASATVAVADAAPPPPTLADLKWSPKQAHVYRLIATSSEGPVATVENAVVVRVDDAGNPHFHVHVDYAQELLHGAIDEQHGRAMLPLPPAGQAHGEGKSQITYLQSYPRATGFHVGGRGNVDESIDARVRDDRLIEVTIKRQVNGGYGTTSTTEDQDGVGLFDPVRGRYERMTWHARVQTKDSTGDPVERTLALEPASSGPPEQTPASAREAEGRAGYDDYLARTSFERELTDASVMGVGGSDPWPSDFLAQAKPNEYWSGIADAAVASRFPRSHPNEDLLCMYAHAVDAEVFKKLFHDATLLSLDPTIIECPAERLAPLFRPLASPAKPKEFTGRDRFKHSGDWKALVIWRTLRVVDNHGDVGPALRAAKPSAWFLDYLTRLAPLTHAIGDRERVSAVPALVDMMRAGHEAAACGRVLAAITMQDFGTDADKWSAYWEAHKSKPYADWISEVALSDKLEKRLPAFEMLGRFAFTKVSQATLQGGLGDPELLVRVAAARAFAMQHDDRGAGILVDALGESATIAGVAFESLASLSDRTLGYSPAAPEETRALAIGRWREWLKRRTK